MFRLILSNEFASNNLTIIHKRRIRGLGLGQKPNRRTRVSENEPRPLPIPAGLYLARSALRTERLSTARPSFARSSPARINFLPRIPRMTR
jgi:hypothetical protein